MNRRLSWSGRENHPKKSSNEVHLRTKDQFKVSLAALLAKGEIPYDFHFLHYDVATSFHYQVGPGHLHNHCYRFGLALLVTEPKNIPLLNILTIGITKITSAQTAALTFETLAGSPRALPYPLLPLKFGGAPTGIITLVPALALPEFLVHMY
ncbi:hypothetical protein BJX62DRAFT_78794 [Aspergillus germanicus]